MPMRPPLIFTFSTSCSHHPVNVNSENQRRDIQKNLIVEPVAVCFHFRAFTAVRQQPLPRRMPALQLVRPQPDRAESEAGAALQEPDTVRSALRRRRAHGVLRLHAAAAQLQAPVVGMRGSEAQIVHHAHLSPAPASLFR